MEAARNAWKPVEIAFDRFAPENLYTVLDIRRVDRPGFILIGGGGMGNRYELNSPTHPRQERP
jgi:hypothetical protein